MYDEAHRRENREIHPPTENNNNSRHDRYNSNKITTRRRQRPSYQRYLTYARRRATKDSRISSREKKVSTAPTKRSNKPTSTAAKPQPTLDEEAKESTSEADLAEATAPGTTTTVEALLRLTAGSYYSAAVRKNRQFVSDGSTDPQQLQPATIKRQP